MKVYGNLYNQALISVTMIQIDLSKRNTYLFISLQYMYLDYNELLNVTPLSVLYLNFFLHLSFCKPNLNTEKHQKTT